MLSPDRRRILQLPLHAERDAEQREGPGITGSHLNRLAQLTFCGGEIASREQFRSRHGMHLGRRSLWRGVAAWDGSQENKDAGQPYRCPRSSHWLHKQIPKLGEEIASAVSIRADSCIFIACHPRVCTTAVGLRKRPKIP